MEPSGIKTGPASGVNPTDEKNPKSTNARRTGNGTHMPVKNTPLLQRTPVRIVLGIMTLGISEIARDIHLNMKTREVATLLQTPVTDDLKSKVAEHQFLPSAEITTNIKQSVIEKLSTRLTFNKAMQRELTDFINNHPTLSANDLATQFEEFIQKRADTIQQLDAKHHITNAQYQPFQLTNFIKDNLHLTTAEVIDKFSALIIQNKTKKTLKILRQQNPHFDDSTLLTFCKENIALSPQKLAEEFTSPSPARIKEAGIITELSTQHLITKEKFDLETLRAHIASMPDKSIKDIAKKFSKQSHELSVFHILFTEHSLTKNVCNTEALKQYSKKHREKTPEDVAKQFMTDFFKPEGIDQFLASKDTKKTLPKLHKIQYNALVNYLLPHMEEYNYDHLFQMLQVIEETFSKKEMKQIEKLDLTQQQLLMQKLFTENARAAHAYLAGL